MIAADTEMQADQVRGHDKTMRRRGVRGAPVAVMPGGGVDDRRLVHRTQQEADAGDE